MRDVLAVVGLSILLLTLPICVALLDWRAHRSRRQQALAAGWRYERRLPRLGGRKALLRSGFVVAGRTPQGVIWELQQDGHQRLFQFSVPELKAPYGSMLIVPRLTSREAGAAFSNAGLRTVRVEGEVWQTRYTALATHERLVKRSIMPDVTRQLLAWPPRDRPGGLQFIAWREDGLEIRGRLTTEWAHVERIVALGTAIAGQIVATDLSRGQRQRVVD